MRFLLLIGVVTWHVISLNAMAADTKSEGLKAVTTSSNTFATKFFKSIAQSEKNKNLICSPISVSMILSLTSYGARGNTEKQMRSVLALPENNELAKVGFSTFLDNLKNYKSVELRMANKIFVANGIQPKAEFKEMATTGFKSEAANVDFSKREQASKTINTWAEEQTNHKIKDLIKPDILGPETAMVLVNAVYFKGNWAEKFNPNNTKPRPFHIDATQTKDVPTMYRSGSYRYGTLPEVKARFIEIPYKSEGKDDAVSMIIVLPDEITGLADLEKNIEKVPLEKLLSGSVRDVNLYLPKFKIESDLELNNVLKEIGMDEMFSGSADFRGIVDSPPLLVSKVVQKAFIEVNEEGSEAAAATGIKITMRCMRYPAEMEFNRPFYYSIVARILDKRDAGYELFSGVVAEPKF